MSPPRKIRALGKELTVAEWAVELGMTQQGLRYRLARMAPELAVTCRRMIRRAPAPKEYRWKVSPRGRWVKIRHSTGED